MSAITERQVSQDVLTPPLVNESSSSYESICLWDFKTGVLRFDHIKQIQAYLRKGREEDLSPSPCVHPFTDLFFVDTAHLDTFKWALHAYCSVRVSNKDGQLKVYLFSKKRGGPMTEKEEEDMVKAHQVYEQGIKDEAEKKSDEALKKYSKCLTVFQSFNPQSLEVANVHGNMGNVYEAQQEFDKAIDDYEKSLKIRILIDPYSKATAELYQRVGNLYWHQNNTDKSLENYIKCLAVLERLTPESLEVADLCRSIGGAAHSDYELALTYYFKSLKIAEKFPNSHQEIGDSCYGIGEAYQAGDKLDQALEFYKKSLALYQGIDPHSLDVVYVNWHIGSVYESEGKLNAAIAQYEESLKICESKDAKSSDTAEALRRLAIAYSNQNSWDKALEHFHKCLEIYKLDATERVILAVVYYDMGLTYERQNKYEEALVNFRKALAIIENAPTDSKFAASLHHNIGEFFFKNDRFMSALEHYEKELALQININPRGLEVVRAHQKIGLSLGNLGSFSWGRLGYIEEAVKHLKMSIELCEAIKLYPVIVADLCDGIARLYCYTTETLDLALPYCLKSLAIYTRIVASSIDEAASNYVMGNFYFYKGNFTAALFYLRKAYFFWNQKGLLKHPVPLFTGNRLAHLALIVGDFKGALDHIDEVIKNHLTYKYAYDTKGQILKKQGLFLKKEGKHKDAWQSLEDAQKSFAEALNCDAGYADASIHLLEVLVELEKISPGSHSIDEAIMRAKELTSTDYYRKKLSQLLIIAQGFSLKVNVKLPREKFIAGRSEYLEKIEEIEKELRLLQPDRRNDRQRGRGFEVKDSQAASSSSSKALEQKEAPLPQGNARFPLLQISTDPQMLARSRSAGSPTFPPVFEPRRSDELGQIVAPIPQRSLPRPPLNSSLDMLNQTESRRV